MSSKPWVCLSGGAGLEEQMSAGYLFPAVTRRCGDDIDVSGDDVPIHHRPRQGRPAAHMVRAINSADRECAAEDDPQKYTHDLFPHIRASGRPGTRRDRVRFGAVASASYRSRRDLQTTPTDLYN